jgi:hypothetical protein
MKAFLQFTLVLLVSITSQMSTAQKLELKDGTVYLLDTAIFSYDQKVPNNEFHLFRLNSEKTIVEMKQVHHSAALNSKNEYKTLTFSKQNVTIESVLLSKRNWKYILQLLLDEKVINTKGVVNLSNLAQFAEKYQKKNN